MMGNGKSRESQEGIDLKGAMPRTTPLRGCERGLHKIHVQARPLSYPCRKRTTDVGLRKKMCSWGFFGVVGEGGDGRDAPPSDGPIQTRVSRIRIRAYGNPPWGTLRQPRCSSLPTCLNIPYCKPPIIILFSVQKNGYKKRKNNAAGGRGIRLFSSLSLLRRKKKKPHSHKH